MGMRWLALAVLGVCLLATCQQPFIAPEVATMSVTPAPKPTPSSTASMAAAKGWRKDRYISVDDAIGRLQPHVDVPVVMPKMKVAYLPRLDRWLADPEDLIWSEENGVLDGEMKLIHRNRILIFSFGLVTFDGCGGTDLAVPTQVGEHPALLFVTKHGTWSQIVWPMLPGQNTGTYGLAGTLEAWQAYQLAQSMEHARQDLPQGTGGC
jgi:hypothetical protein